MTIRFKFIFNTEEGTSLLDLLLALITLIVLTSINALINALSDIYSKSRYADRFKIKSYIQIVKLLVNIFGGIFLDALPSLLILCWEAPSQAA